ncbi:MAG: MlaD family protein [Chitinophagales bacterium]|nr:MlaD family protein [Chitinophagales bacterium]
MEKERRSQIKTGVFVLLGLGLFIGLVYILGSRQNLFGGTFKVVCVFKNVGGLQAGNNVRFAGINVGTVTNISILNDTSVQVVLSVDEKVRKHIKKDSKASIGSEGLMGNKLVTITNGSYASEQIEDGEVLLTIKPVDMEDVMVSIKEVSDNAAELTANLSDISEKIKNGEGTIGALMTDKTLINNVNSAIVSIDDAASSFDRNMDALSKTFLFRKQPQEEEKKK